MQKKPLKRVYRTEHISPEQARRDRELREKIQAEFPPLRPVVVAPALSASLRNAIATSRKPIGQLAKEAGISPTMVTRFVAGNGDLRLAAADKLAQVLRLKLVVG